MSFLYMLPRFIDRVYTIEKSENIDLFIDYTLYKENIKDLFEEKD